MTLYLEIGRKVEVYRNLNLARKDPTRFVWSVRAPHGKVLDHRYEIILENVEFVVRESRRQAVIRSQCREVHAWVSGTVAAAPEFIGGRDAAEWLPITYSPYRAGVFTLMEDRCTPVLRADYVRFTRDGAFAVL